jgi:nitrilase
MRVVRAAGVQLSPVLYSREGTVEKVVRKIHELGQQGVQYSSYAKDNFVFERSVRYR